jgi:flagellar operon protein
MAKLPVDTIAATGPVTRPARAARPAPADGPAFAEALRFSTHARQRLAQRGIALDSDDLARLEGAVAQADAKGGHESLILLDELALVVSIDNRTVITAVDASNPGGNVFTNVDSVVIAPRGAS